MGMLAAEIVSQRAIGAESTMKPLDFGNDIWTGEGQAQQYCFALRSLVIGSRDCDIKDKPLEKLCTLVTTPVSDKPELKKAIVPKVAQVTKKEPKLSKSKIQIIDSSTPHTESEDDLVPYAMPDEPEESDSDLDDPSSHTLGKKKASAPVYISDLAEYLRATDNAEKLAMGLQEAAVLIRKKIGWGFELGTFFKEGILLSTNLSRRGTCCRLGFRSHWFARQFRFTSIWSEETGCFGRSASGLPC